MSHMPEYRHKSADCNCEALELREDLVLERAVNARLVAEMEVRIAAAVAEEREAIALMVDPSDTLYGVEAETHAAIAKAIRNRGSR